MLQTLPSTPLWLELTKAFGGPVIAAAVVVVGLIWKDRIERRNVAQAWFEQTYIAEGIDVLIAHLDALDLQLSDRRRLILPETNIPPLSAVVQARLVTIIPGAEFLHACEIVQELIFAAIRNDHPLVLSKEELTELSAYCIALQTHAEGLRSSFLSIPIKSKKDIYDIQSLPQFVELIQPLEETFMGDKSLKSITDGFAEKFATRLQETAEALKALKAKAARDTKPAV